MADRDLAIPKREIAAFCRRHHINRLSVFGSFLREDFGPESDIDVLVEFEQGHSPGLSFFSMQSELADILGHKVELHTPAFLSRYFRDRVLQEAEVQYGQPWRFGSLTGNGGRSQEDPRFLIRTYTS